MKLAQIFSTERLCTIVLYITMFILITSCDNNPNNNNSNNSNFPQNNNNNQANNHPSNNSNNNSQQANNGNTNNNISIDFIRTYEGKINNQYPITFKITSNNGQVSGTYFYNSVGKDLQLKGTIDNNGNINLTEYDAKGNMTGIFKGNIKNNSKIEGQWSKPNGSSTMPFFLIESNASYNTAQQQSQNSVPSITFKGKWSSEGGMNNEGIMEMVLEQKGNSIVGTFKYEDYNNNYQSGIINVNGTLQGNKANIQIIDNNGRNIGKAAISKDGKNLLFSSNQNRLLPKSIVLYPNSSVSH